MPPEHFDSSGNGITANVSQLWLWERYQMFQDLAFTYVGSDPFDLILMGDLIQGKRAKWESELVVHSEGAQLALAKIVLEPFVKRAARVFVILGTESHTSDTEKEIADAFGAVESMGGPAWDRLDIDYHGCPCSFAHHMPTTSRPWTEATGHGVVSSAEIIEAVKANETPARLCVSAHRHKFGYAGDDFSLSLSCPPWQIPNRYAMKVGRHFRTTVGGLILDWRKVEHGSLPQFVQRVYRPPSARHSGGHMEGARQVKPSGVCS
jgi:hypothetical protein